ncbi:hypothetical protein B0H13DRAFT_2338883 [Mycena leptocephala]|nr:hypothetical protein B0H13DRAFT_2338883 [Mycena leptocephala]
MSSSVPPGVRYDDLGWQLPDGEYDSRLSTGASAYSLFAHLNPSGYYSAASTRYIIMYVLLSLPSPCAGHTHFPLHSNRLVLPFLLLLLLGFVFLIRPQEPLQLTTHGLPSSTALRHRIRDHSPRQLLCTTGSPAIRLPVSVLPSNRQLPRPTCIGHLPTFGFEYIEAVAAQELNMTLQPHPRQSSRLLLPYDPQARLNCPRCSLGYAASGQRVLTGQTPRLGRCLWSSHLGKWSTSVHAQRLLFNHCTSPVTPNLTIMIMHSAL